MANTSCQEMAVTIKQRERVKAEGILLQEHWLPLSNLDFLLPPTDVGVFFVYQNHDGRLNSSSMFSTLKKSLSEALAAFYPLAGELAGNLQGELQILCNNRGVDFIEAYFERGIAELNLHNPEECIEGKLVPQKNGGVICIQGTELKCGGLVVVCVFDHRIADAYSINMFMLGWSELACSKPISLIPFCGRTLHQVHCAGHYSPPTTHLYVPAFFLSSEKFGSYHFGWGGKVGHIMPMPSATCEGDWIVYARLMEWQVEALEVEGEGVFRSLTSSHLMLSGDSAEE